MFWVYWGLGFRKVTIYATFILFYFYVRYCENLRCVGFLCNSQACLAMSSADLSMFCNVLGMLCKVLGRPQHALCFATPLACFTRSLAHLGMLLQGPMEAWWYTTPLASQLIRQQVRGFLFDVGLLGPCKSMSRWTKDLAKHAKDIAKHAEVSRGRCQACLGVAKQAYTSQVPIIKWPTSACFCKVLRVPHRRETPPLFAL